MTKQQQPEEEGNKEPQIYETTYVFDNHEQLEKYLNESPLAAEAGGTEGKLEYRNKFVDWPENRLLIEVTDYIGLRQHLQGVTMKYVPMPGIWRSQLL